MQDAKVAFVQDALPFWGGAEQTLAALLAAFPLAPVYTLVYNPAAFRGTIFAERQVHTSWLNRLPGARRNHYRYFPLFADALRAFDLSAYDVVVSCSYAAAHAVRTQTGQAHIGYTYTPMRYLWQQREEWLAGVAAPLRPLARRAALRYRQRDRRIALQPQRTVAISGWIARLIRRAYGVRAGVIYPPVDTARFAGSFGQGDYFVALSRLARHKRLDLVVDAFTRLGLPLVVIGEGAEGRRLKRRAGSNVVFRGWLADRDLARTLGGARALVHMAAEDFGIGLVEAQAAGVPVIAYAGGANVETVIPGETGLLVPRQSAESLAEVVSAFAAQKGTFSAARLRLHAERFSTERFQGEWRELVGRAGRG
jgi:glycosyltransferase involved in cell wall biosynthesis